MKMNGGYLLAPAVTFQNYLDEIPFDYVSKNSQEFHDESPNDMITINEDYTSSVSLPSYPYSFNSDLYKSGSLTIPKNILYIVRNRSTKTKDSISYHMPHLNQFEFTPKDQKEFITRFFPDKLGLYKSFSHEEERNNLFVYLWLYMNGGIYIDSDYELMKSLDPILDTILPADLYFMYDDDRYISPKFIASQPFCEFWMDVINLMDKRKNHKYTRSREQIDRNTGRGLLTDIVDETTYRYEIIPRSQLDPYNSCDKVFSKESFLRPSNRTQDFVTSVSCSTGSSNEVIYITGVIIFVIVIMVIIALMTR